MKTKNFLLMASLVALQLINAQTADKKFAIGISGIRNEYNGDYGNGMFDFKQSMYPAAGLSLSAYLSPSFNLGLQGSYGNYGYVESDTEYFNGRKVDVSLFTHYKFDNGYLLSKETRFSPFLSLGVGVAFYGINSFVDKSEVDPSLNPTIITKGIDLIIPVGIGIKYHLTSRFAVQYQYLYTITSGDNHDQNMGPAYFGTTHTSKDGNDAYGQHVFTFAFNFGKSKDTDKDGIADIYDKCPETAINVKVDANGCPIDTDGDGVPDYLDKCENTPAGVQVDAVGCALDSDGDGVADYLDKCSNTPAGVKVDASGCSIDKDGDGVADDLDKCPNTPAGVKVDATGCALDSDGDGVADDIDKCPNTPSGVKVDATGCAMDTDGDGVADYMDKCPGTPAAAYGKVDINGCPLDTDGDGIADYLDNCPNIAGSASNHGCPEVKQEVKALFRKALQGIQFETGKSDIKPFSYPLLNQIANALIINPTYLIEVQGHTDNVGGYDYNIDLSNRRAASVRLYLVDKGVTQERITSQGYGYNKPVASNNTRAGKAMNRRVEFVVTFEK